jgi:hypothetical protein
MRSPGIELVHEGVEAVLLLQACLSLAGGLSGGGTMSHRNLVERLFPWIRGNVASSSVGSIIPRTASVSSSSPALLSCSGDFEIGSSDQARSDGRVASV